MSRRVWNYFGDQIGDYNDKNTRLYLNYSLQTYYVINLFLIIRLIHT